MQLTCSLPIIALTEPIIIRRKSFFLKMFCFNSGDILFVKQEHPQPENQFLKIVSKKKRNVQSKIVPKRSLFPSNSRNAFVRAVCTEIVAWYKLKTTS